MGQGQNKKKEMCQNLANPKFIPLTP